ncbi:hypothetical protein M3Y97_00164000 [Aphelenchoides bicaudatus]|nr:hypothetical protein M3Y97_00164000 [Aphelenchoides bicaudatus]
MNSIHNLMKRFDQETCMCGTPITAGVHIVAWMFLMFDAAIVLFLMSFKSYAEIDWADVLYLCIENILTLSTSILLLFGINKKLPRFYVPFMVVNSVMFVFEVIRVSFSVIVSIVSAMFHHFTGTRVVNFYNVFVHINMYDVFHDRPHLFLVMLFYSVLHILFVVSYGYSITVVYRHYCSLVQKDKNHYSCFSNPEFSPFHQQNENVESSENDGQELKTKEIP